MNETLKDNKILKINKLKKYYPVRAGFLRRVVNQVKAVDSINFDVIKGETLGLVGESGCGKTTTARLIVRAIEATEGEVLLKLEDETLDILKMDKQEIKEMRKNIQMIYQDPFSSLNPRMTVLDIISEPLVAMRLMSRKERKARVEELLPRCGLKVVYMNRYPHSFSGGQRQRIGIARALAPDPRVIVADEPVSALDVSVQAQILNLMLDLQQDFGLSYIFIAHDLSVVKHISDRIAVMYVGKLVEISPAEGLFKKPLHPYTESLLQAIPNPDPDIRSGEINLEGSVADAADTPDGCNFHPRCRYATDICQEEEPELQDLGEGKDRHLVACHHAREIDLSRENVSVS